MLQFDEHNSFFNGLKPPTDGNQSPMEQLGTISDHHSIICSISTHLEWFLILGDGCAIYPIYEFVGLDMVKGAAQVQNFQVIYLRIFWLPHQPLNHVVFEQCFEERLREFGQP